MAQLLTAFADMPVRLCGESKGQPVETTFENQPAPHAL